MPVSLIFGPMFSGKSTRLIERIERYSRAKKSCLIVRNICDTRTADGVLETHGGLIYNKCLILKTKSLNSVDINNFDVIAIDEGQFFESDDLFNFCHKNMHKEIIISALNGDFKQKPFITISNIIPLCTHIDKLSSICECGKDADYSKRTSKEDSQIVVGNDYIASCFACL